MSNGNSLKRVAHGDIFAGLRHLEKAGVTSEHWELLQRCPEELGATVAMVWKDFLKNTLITRFYSSKNFSNVVDVLLRAGRRLCCGNKREFPESLWEKNYFFARNNLEGKEICLQIKPFSDAMVTPLMSLILAELNPDSILPFDTYMLLGGGANGGGENFFPKAWRQYELVLMGTLGMDRLPGNPTGGNDPDDDVPAITVLRPYEDCGETWKQERVLLTKDFFWGVRGPRKMKHAFIYRVGGITTSEE